LYPGLNAKSGAIDQLRLGDQTVDRDRRVGHPWCSVTSSFPHATR